MNGTAAGLRARSVAATKRGAWPKVMTSSAVRRIRPLFSAAAARARRARRGRRGKAASRRASPPSNFSDDRPTRWTVASLAVEGVAIFRRYRLEARGQGFNEHGVAAFRLRQNGHAGQRAVGAPQNFGPMLRDGHLK